jgi:hypothetical protein
MKTQTKAIFGTILVTLICCHLTALPCEEPSPKANTPTRETDSASAEPKTTQKSAFVLGFVKKAGPVPSGMTIQAAIEKAGGRGGCTDCEEAMKRDGHHPSFDFPPRLTRGGKVIKWSRQDDSWKKFTLEPGDIVEVLHILW